jgi:hypothetical protein
MSARQLCIGKLPAHGNCSIGPHLLFSEARNAYDPTAESRPLVCTALIHKTQGFGEPSLGDDPLQDLVFAFRRTGQEDDP